ncbi:MAG: hypothetical protein PHP08_05045 [Candidatus Dojkabacteria bacterium]|nr:hypothetical protein [Candidatus Dojkabacteria bacterium]
MKKETSLFLIIFLIVFIGLIIYFFNRPKSIENKIVGDEYNAEYIQFDLVAETFSPIPQNIVEREGKTYITFVSSDNKIISVSPIEKENLFVNQDKINNPFYIFQEEVKGTLKDWRFTTIKILHGEKKDVVYYYANGSDEDGTFSRNIEVSMNDAYYLIELSNYESKRGIEADAYEIMSSVNIIKN